MTHIQIDNVYIHILLKNTILVIIHLEVKVNKNFMLKITYIEKCKITQKMTDKMTSHTLIQSYTQNFVHTPPHFPILTFDIMLTTCAMVDAFIF